MQTARFVAMALAACATTPAIAGSPFDGTWKIDLQSTKLDPKPMVLSLVGGTFRCSSCSPVLTVAADGKTHPVAGRDYTDAVAVKVVDPHSISMTSYKGGKVVREMTDSVSADGKTLTTKFTGTNPITGARLTGGGTSTRLTPAPAGAHMISGSWHDNPLDTLSDTGTVMTLKVEGKKFALTTPGGVGYIAMLGGPAVMQKGDVAKTMISVVRTAPDTIVETDRRAGKVVDVITMRVAPDGKSMTYIDQDKKAGRTDRMTARKQ